MDQAAPAHARKVGDDAQSVFDPYWNHGARWIAFYLLPIGLLLVGLRFGLIDFDGRDFWVPALWGLWMPWFNGRDTPLKGLKKFVFRDFNQNEFWPLGVLLMHAVTWNIGVSVLGAPTAVVAFVVAMLLYDAFMLKFALLDIYALPRHIAEQGWPRHLAHFGFVWWPYVAIGFYLAHRFGSDSLLFIIGFTLVWIIPMQLVLHACTHRKRIRLQARRVAVIGAGWSGLYATKWCRQAGLEVETFDKADSLGGVWRYRDEPGGVAKNTFASSSKDFMHASDFPLDQALPSFPTHQQIAQFLHDYAQHFEIGPSIRFGCAVERIEKRDGGWTVHLATATGGVSREFDAVVITAGTNAGARGDGFAQFGGTTMHSAEFKDASCIDAFKRILVVGVGESGADIAHECAQRRSAQVYWSGGPQWFADRYIGGRHAADAFMAPGIRTLLAYVLNLEDIGRRIVQSGIGFFWGAGGSDVPIWKPSAPWLHGFVTKSRDAIADVHTGLITPKGAIQSMSDTRILFDDGSDEAFDLIIDCTGYAPRFGFLDEKCQALENYKLVFNQSDPSLAFIGLARPLLGSIPALAELQARWVASVFSGATVLPATEQMNSETRCRQRIHRKRFYGSLRRPNLVEHEFYAREIAAELDIGVPWLQLLCRHPLFFIKLLTAPWYPFKYNLANPSTRAQAMANILSNKPAVDSPVYVFMLVFLGQGLLVLAALSAALVVLVQYAPAALWVFLALMFCAHRLAARFDRDLR